MSFQIFDTAAGRPGGHAASARQKVLEAARLSGGTAARASNAARYAPSAAATAPPHLHRQSSSCATAMRRSTLAMAPVRDFGHASCARRKCARAARLARVQRGLAAGGKPRPLGPCPRPGGAGRARARAGIDVDSSARSEGETGCLAGASGRRLARERWTARRARRPRGCEGASRRPSARGRRTPRSRW